MTPARGCTGGRMLVQFVRPDDSRIGGHVDVCAGVEHTFDPGGPHNVEVWGVRDAAGDYSFVIEEI